MKGREVNKKSEGKEKMERKYLEVELESAVLLDKGRRK